MSTMVAESASSLETNSLVPSLLMSNASGSEPPGSTLVTFRLATSMTPMPSLVLSAFSFSHSSSGMVGGQRGEPLRATKIVPPSSLSRMPRGRVPTVMVPTTLSFEVSMMVSSPDPSLVTYASSPSGVSAVAAAESVPVSLPGWRSPPPQAARPTSTAILERWSPFLVLIEKCLVAVAGLVQALGP
jgi:hypothetical protein